MFQPKQFYRELEELLQRSPEIALTDEWYPGLAARIVERFGATLQLGDWRLYEEGDDGFDLQGVAPSRGADPQPVDDELPADSPALGAILENGTYLFHAGQWHPGGSDTGAILLESEPRRVIVFGLEPGWQRDDVDFTLNTVRNALNLRIRLESLHFDLEQAAEIQRSLLPRTVPRFPGYTLAARSIPAERVGGDFFDFLPDSDPGTLLFAIGDASGHGLGAALMARDMVTGLRMGAVGALKITEIVRRLNRVLSRSRLASRFVSLFLGELGADGDLHYVNAGHPHAFIVGPGATRRLGVGGTVVGPLDDANFRGGWARIEPGETLVVVTDGILEQPDDHGREFGEAAVERRVRDLAGKPAPEVLDALFGAAREHGGSRPWTDDTSAILVVRNPA